MASVNNYALVDTPFSHEPAATGNHVSTLTYRAGCTHVPTINLGTGNPSVNALTLTTAKSVLIPATDAKYVTCVWALREVRSYGNNITALDVSNNTVVTYLHCGANSLTALGVSANTALTTLYCHSNLLNDAAIDTLIAGMDSVAWATTARVLYIHDQPAAANINTGTTCTSLGNLASKGWVITYDQGTCAV